MSIVASRGSDQFPVRLPDGLRDEIKAEAARNGRSMNAEIVARIQGNSMSLRDWFAGQAMAGLLSNEGRTPPSITAAAAYAHADAMLKAREPAP